VAALRRELDRAKPGHLLDGKLPLIAGTAVALGFLRAGGVGATLRLAAAKRRHARELEQPWWRRPL
jgi:hypothetical protein